MAEKLYYSMGEVAEMFDVNPSLIRHWESQFSVLRPKRNKKGNRLFTPQDVENLKRIYHLVKECGMTLDGAKRALRNQPSGDAAAREAELIERLQRIRALLLEVREDLRDVPGEVVGPDSAVDAASEAHTPGHSRTRRLGRGARNDAADRAPDHAADASATDASAAADASADVPAAASGTPARPAARRPRRKKEEAEHKELFAFYEQSLF